ncbi:NUP49 [Mytilus edulis]|uniref:NUPL1 n=1 Tax=Mytilus edulis TaxID=6550 RepID=A0A8S3QKJ1_MYTED|nr:NUP49 [Mytilus edulis]
MDVLPTRFLTFEVKACKHVALYASSSDNKDSTKPLYEIAIGAAHDTRTFIRRRNDASLQESSRVTKQQYIENMLNCSEYRPFWISWEAGIIIVGSGNVVGDNVIVSWIDPNPFIVKSLGILTLDMEVGEWKVFIPVKDNFTGYYTSCEAPGKRAVLLSFGVFSSRELQCSTMCSQLNTCVVYNYNNQDKRKYTKSEKNVQDDLARSTSKPLYKVQEDVVALRQLLSVVSNGIQRNALVVEKLKHEMTQELKNAEMSMRTKDIPPGLQYDNTAPAEYFHRLVEDFENQMLSYRQQIETLEEHLASTHQPNKLTPDDLILLLRKLHETFIALAAQLHQVHEAVKTQKEHYLNYRKIFLHDTNNIFEPEKKQQPQTRQDTSTHLGPTPFGGLTNAAAVAMASALTRSQQPAGPPVAGLAGNLGQTAGFGSTGLFGGGTTQPAAFGATTATQPGIGGFGGFGTTTTQPAGFKGFGSGFGTTTTTQSTGFGAGFGATGGTATVRPLGFGTATTAASGFGGQSTFGQTGSLFGTAPAAAPAFGANGEPFQLNKPPTSKKKR